MHEVGRDDGNRAEMGTPVGRDLKLAQGSTTPMAAPDGGTPVGRDLESELLSHVRCRLQIPADASIPFGAPLAALLVLSPVGTDSLDLLEAFARAIVDLDRDLDADVPAFTTRDEVGAVCHTIVQQALDLPPATRSLPLQPF